MKCQCRKCGRDMETKEQTSIVKGKPGFWYLTCKHPDCKLFDQTFTDRDYATLDLAPYLK